MSGLTERGHLAMLFARAEAREAGAPEVTPAHLLAGLLREDEGLAADVLAEHGVRLADVRMIEEARGGAPVGEGEADGPPLDATTRRVVERAASEARWMELEHAATEHLLLGLVHESGGAVIRLLLDSGLTEKTVREAVSRRRRSGPSWL